MSHLTKLTRAKNTKMDSNKSKGSFEYLWVGKVWGTTKKLGFPKLLLRFWALKVQNWPKDPKPYRGAYRAKQDHFSTQFEALSINLTWKIQILHIKVQSGQNFGLIGPKLAQKAKILLVGLECQTRPLFHSVWDPEFEFYKRSPNVACRRPNLAKNWV